MWWYMQEVTRSPHKERLTDRGPHTPCRGAGLHAMGPRRPRSHYGTRPSWRSQTPGVPTPVSWAAVLWCALPRRPHSLQLVHHWSEAPSRDRLHERSCRHVSHFCSTVYTRVLRPQLFTKFWGHFQWTGKHSLQPSHEGRLQNKDKVASEGSDKKSSEFSHLFSMPHNETFLAFSVAYLFHSQILQNRQAQTIKIQKVKNEYTLKSIYVNQCKGFRWFCCLFSSTLLTTLV